MGGLFSKPKVAPLPPVPPPIPPVVQTSQDVVQSSRDARRAAGKRKGMKSTILGGAGNAGGTSYSDTAGTRTLLGGG